MSIKPKALKARVSVVVPCEPGGNPSPCLGSLAALPRAEKSLIREVFVAWGRHPSRQRNLAVAQARAPWVLFLDSDSRVEPGLIPALLAAARDLGAVAAGGPNLPLREEPALGLDFDAVQASWAGSGASRTRYAPVGSRRLAGEKQLILCNLLMRRDVFLQAGGFREDLYPNEENELFNRLQAQGHGLAYEPAAQVRRPRRSGVRAFALQAFRYGRGRAQQMRRNPFAGDLVNLAPLLLQAALVLGGRGLWLLYGLACLAAMRLHPLRALYLALRQQAYALGLWVGAFQDPASRDPVVRVRRVRLTGARS